jgi:hypothetical protein
MLDFDLLDHFRTLNLSSNFCRMLLHVSVTQLRCRTVLHMSHLGQACVIGCLSFLMHNRFVTFVLLECSIFFFFFFFTIFSCVNNEIRCIAVCI